MKPLAIEAQNIGKRFEINTPKAATLRDTLARLWSGRWFKKQQELWALRDVSFDVEQGEVVGIIGSNGAGKSTLLKILSRITPPTTGQATINGRIASLLEVGTGFHHELTGRENIFLNGVILGMSRQEVRKKFDQIVAFSGVEDFIDTPVKHYSSGMYVRLAFAVAAHLEAEVLLIDEVLSIGDIAFQRKSLQKMKEITQEGKTVLVVSHNEQQIKSLCPRTILIDKGEMQCFTDTHIAWADYQELYLEARSPVYRPPNPLPDNLSIGIESITLLNADKKATNTLKYQEPFSFLIELHSKVELSDISIVLGFNVGLVSRIITCASHQNGFTFNANKNQRQQIVAHFDDLTLFPGNYSIYVSVRSGMHARYINIDVPNFLMVTSEAFGNHAYEGHWGYLRGNPEWKQI